jgi:hypothetical protein
MCSKPPCLNIFISKRLPPPQLSSSAHNCPTSTLVRASNSTSDPSCSLPSPTLPPQLLQRDPPLCASFPLPKPSTNRSAPLAVLAPPHHWVESTVGDAVLAPPHQTVESTPRSGMLHWYPHNKRVASPPRSGMLHWHPHTRGLSQPPGQGCCTGTPTAKGLSHPPGQGPVLAPPQQKG